MKDLWPGGTPYGGSAVGLDDYGNIALNYVLTPASEVTNTEVYVLNGTNLQDIGTFY
jgi:hypothetical protein